ncbi:MAG: hypothetical protein AB1814_07035 [Thermodesulfobacteriota bacterium]
MNKINIELPVPVLKYPHWRVNIRPAEYNNHLIPTLNECINVIEKTKVSLRGWNYPHLSHRREEQAFGGNWIASWSDFMGHNEYWRFYQSGQFVHLFSVREATEPGWRKEIEETMRSHMRDREWSEVPGFISILNFIYTTTEIFEFAARLCETGIYAGIINISITLKDIRGFVLSAGWDRSRHEYYAADEESLKNSWPIKSDALVAESIDYSRSAIIWFFERFGWLSPPIEVIRRDQENLLKKLIY